jgi:Tfp pilus assembly protein PilF
LKDDPQQARALIPFAAFCARQKQYDRAEGQLTRALELLDKRGNPDLRYLASTLDLMVEVKAAKGEAAAAGPYAQRLKEVRAQLKPADSK